MALPDFNSTAFCKHVEEAEALVASIADSDRLDTRADLLATAQVHATLALAFATKQGADNEC